MTLLGFGGPKVFIITHGVNSLPEGPAITYWYLVVNIDDTVLPGPSDVWFTKEMVITYSDTKLSIQAKIRTAISHLEDLDLSTLTLNAVFL